MAQGNHHQQSTSGLRSRHVPSVVRSNGLAVIRDVEDPGPTIEPNFLITGIRLNKIDSSGLEVLGNETQCLPSTTETHPDALDMSTVLGY